MSLPVNPSVDPPADPFDEDERPLWSDSEVLSDPGPHDSLLDSDEERELALRMAAAQAAAQRERRLNGRAVAPAGPPLNPADAPRVEALAADLVRETRGRERFSAFPVEEFSAAAAILVRYRIGSLEVLRQTQKDARTLFIRDLAAYFPFENKHRCVRSNG